MKKIIFSVVFLHIVSLLIGQVDVNIKKVMVRMDDGTGLSTNIYIPKVEGQYPTILIRTPYNKLQHETEGIFFASNGYAVVVQDCRGSIESEGDFTPFINEEKDGLETLDWVTEQSWSNGSVGLWGSSYLTFTSLVIAQNQPEAVGSIFSISGWLKSDRMVMPGGTFHLQLSLPWMLYEKSLQTGVRERHDYPKLFNTTPLDQLFDSLGIMADFLVDIRAGKRAFDHDYSTERIEVPVFHITGWYDFVNEAQFDIYHTVKNNGKTNKLIVGPWIHDQIFTDRSIVGEEDFGAESVLGRAKLNRLALQWYDHTLKGMENEIQEMSNARIFVMGSNNWKEFTEFPPKKLAETKYYLSNNGEANSLLGSGSLSKNIPRKDKKDNFIFDPMNPVPTFGGSNFHAMTNTIGIKDRTEIEKREDVLVYTSDVLEEAETIIGKVTVELYVSTEGKDTDFTATVVEVRPDGYARIVTEGVQRMSKLKGMENWDGAVSDEIYKVEIDLGHTAIEIDEGSRIRIEVSSSNFPKYDRNPNTGEDPFSASKFIPVKQTIWSGKSYPSALKVYTL